MTVVRRLSSDELTPREAASLRALFDAAWPDREDAFTDEDLDHALGGVHFVVEEAGVTPTSPELDLTAPISCDWRPGDVW